MTALAESVQMIAEMYFGYATPPMPWESLKSAIGTVLSMFGR